MANQMRDRSPLTFAAWTIRMAPAQGQGDVEGLRDFTITSLIKRGVVDKHGVKTSDYNHLSIAAYTIDAGNPNDPSPPQFSAIYLGRTKILEAYLVKENVWITITFKSPNKRESDEKDFYAALDSLKITDTAAASTSFDYYQKGRSLVVRGEHQRAIEPLTAAFDLELTKQNLNAAQCRGLVQALLKAYRATGNRARLKEILDFGVSRDPTYPGFHLLLARHYAALGDLDNTITSLQKTFLYKNNKDEFTHSLPDPMTDPGFQRFQNIEQFRQAVKAMKK